MKITMKNLKRAAINKFDGLVKAAANRAIPIAKGEAVKAVTKSVEGKTEEILDVIKMVVIGAVLLSPGIRPRDMLTGMEVLESGVQTINITIENLTINT